MQEKAFYKGGTDWTFQPAQDQGQRARWKAASSAGRRAPDPESGEQWMPFSKVNLVLEGKRTQGAQKTQCCVVGRHLSVLVFVFGSPCLCVCRHCLWSHFLVHRSLLSLLLPFFSDLPSTPTLFRSFSEQANGCGGN